MTPPPRDPSAPSEGFSEPHQVTGSFIVREREYTPVEPMMTQSSPPERKFPSTGFIVSLSVLLGIILAGATLVGGLGKAFFVTRDEHTVENLTYVQDRERLQADNTNIKQTLGRLEESMQKVVDTVQTLKENMASRQGRRE